MEGDNSIGKAISPRRQKILEKAFAQLRKSRAAMDPSLLSKIRRIVAGSPVLMKKLGLTENLTPDADMPLSNKAVAQPLVQPPPVKTVKPDKKVAQGYEAVDQAKNMEVMAKLMALNPSNREKIKSAIKKASD